MAADFFKVPFTEHHAQSGYEVQNCEAQSNVVVFSTWRCAGFGQAGCAWLAFEHVCVDQLVREVAGGQELGTVSSNRVWGRRLGYDNRRYNINITGFRETTSSHMTIVIFSSVDLLPTYYTMFSCLAVLLF